MAFGGLQVSIPISEYYVLGDSVATFSYAYNVKSKYHGNDERDTLTFWVTAHAPYRVFAATRSPMAPSGEPGLLRIPEDRTDTLLPRELDLVMQVLLRIPEDKADSVIYGNRSIDTNWAFPSSGNVPYPGFIPPDAVELQIDSAYGLGMESSYPLLKCALPVKGDPSGVLFIHPRIGIVAVRSSNPDFDFFIYMPYCDDKRAKSAMMSILGLMHKIVIMETSP